MLQFGFLAAVFWWVLIAFNMCLEVSSNHSLPLLPALALGSHFSRRQIFFGELLSLEKAKWKWLRFGIYNVVAWGAAFVLMVIPAAAGEIKFAPAAT